MYKTWFNVLVNRNHSKVLNNSHLQPGEMPWENLTSIQILLAQEPPSSSSGEEPHSREPHLRESHSREPHSRSHTQGSHSQGSHTQGSHSQVSHTQGATLKEATLKEVTLKGATLKGATLLWSRQRGITLKRPDCTP